MSAEIIQFVPRPNLARQRMESAFNHIIYNVGTTDRSVFDPDAFARAFSDDVMGSFTEIPPKPVILLKTSNSAIYGTPAREDI